MDIEEAVAGQRPDRSAHGHRGARLSERWTTSADVRAVIPMAEGIDSLNVAAATAVACYVARGRRSQLTWSRCYVASMSTAFVLGGGGVLGAAEVGMLRALFEAGVEPGPRRGHLGRGAERCARRRAPRAGVVDRLMGCGRAPPPAGEVYGDRAVAPGLARAAQPARTCYSSAPLRKRLHEELGDLTFEELPVPFQCCAASIERAAEHWFTSGRVVDAVMASAAVPGLLRAGARSTASTTSTAAS